MPASLEQKRAAQIMRQAVENDRLKARPKQNDESPSGRKAGGDAPIQKARPAYDPSKAAEKQAEGLLKRKPSYNVGDPSWNQTTDGHQ